MYKTWSEDYEEDKEVEDLEPGVGVRFHNPYRIRGVALLKFKLITESSCFRRYIILSIDSVVKQHT